MKYIKNECRGCESLSTNPENPLELYCSLLKKPIKNEKDMEEYSKKCKIVLELV
ncbi:MAG: hypothetical protein QW472_05485 [Candidatus Aenigmatarchaeota archaeon]